MSYFDCGSATGPGYSVAVPELAAWAEAYPARMLAVRVASRTLALSLPDSPVGSRSFARRAALADMSFPVVLTRHPRWGLLILDGCHRIWRAAQEDRAALPARIVPYDALRRFSRRLKRTST